MEQHSPATTAGRARRRGLRSTKWLVSISSALLFVALAIFLVAPPGFPGSLFYPTYDGWTPGGVDTCPQPDWNPDVDVSQPTAWDCEATLALWLDKATAAFDRRDPGHAAIAKASIHFNGSRARFLCNPLQVAVFVLADGTTRAIGVGHFCVDVAHLTTGDYGPDK